MTEGQERRVAAWAFADIDASAKPRPHRRRDRLGHDRLRA